MMLKPSFAAVLAYAVSFALPGLALAADAAGKAGTGGRSRRSRLQSRPGSRLRDWIALRALEVVADRDGTVWLSGTTPTEEAAERAVDIARNADGVMLVKSHISVEARRGSSLLFQRPRGASQYR